jgi:hypothetical protein
MITVNGHILDVPHVAYNPASDTDELDVRSLQNGKWDLQNKVLAVTSNKPIRYSLLELRSPRRTFGPKLDHRTQFEKNLQQVLTTYGLVGQCIEHTPEEKWHCLQLNLFQHRNEESEEDLDFQEMKGKLQALKNKGVEIVMVLLPDKDANTYAILKRAGDVTVGIQTICTVSGGSGPKDRDDFLANLVLKFNLKASEDAVNQKLVERHNVPVLDNTTRILGMDVEVTHGLHTHELRSTTLTSNRHVRGLELSRVRQTLQQLWAVEMATLLNGRLA